VPILKKPENSQMKTLMMHFKFIEKQEHTKPQNSKQREIIKIKAEINEIETKQTIQRINETKCWYVEEINKIGKPLANMTKWRQEKTQINQIRDEKGDITTNAKEPRKSLKSTLKMYIQVNWKILMKWTNS
jgi:hypothetical protein